MRLLHTADIHLAKPFGRFDEDTRVALRDARLGALTKLGEAARAKGASLIVIAGDTFDAEAPPSKVIRRALGAMAQFDDITWVLMPGNHDSLAAVSLWEQVAAQKPDNLFLALTPEVIEIGNDIAVLPAPPTVRNPGTDLTAWMAQAETEGRIRIGLAHGGVHGFDSETNTAAIIPPDRAVSAQLDYLALGDWHGQLQITPNTYYAGTPEPDSFKPHAPAGPLLIDIAAPGAPPGVTPLPSAVYHWHQITLDCFAGSDPVSQLEDALPPTQRAQSLIRLDAGGRLGLQEHEALRAACAKIADDFHAFDARLDGLGIEQVAADLDLIAEGGALRAAADSLFAATSLEGRTAEDAEIAQIALKHLFHAATDAPDP